MRPDSVRLSRRHKAWIYACLGALLVSGVLWLVATTWLQTEGEFGELRSPLAPWAMKIHGAVAMAFLVLFGTLLQSHVPRAWSSRRSRGTGGAVLTLVGLLILSGYGLYYLGGETARKAVSILHWTVGLVVPVALAWHIRSGRRLGASQLLRLRPHLARRRVGSDASRRHPEAQPEVVSR